MGKHNLWLRELTFKKLRPARAAEPSIKDAAIRGNWIGNDLRQRNGQPSIEEKLYVNRQHVHALNKYSQQKKKIMPSVDISTTTINKQRIALSGRFCWRNQKTTKYQPMVTTSMETTWKADNLLDRIRTAEPLEKRQNVGRAKQKPTTQKDQRYSNNNAGRADQKAGHTNKSWLRAGFDHRNHLFHWRQHQQIFYNATHHTGISWLTLRRISKWCQQRDQQHLIIDHTSVLSHNDVSNAEDAKISRNTSR